MTDDEFASWAKLWEPTFDKFCEQGARAGVNPAALLLLLIGSMGDAYPNVSLPEILSEVGVELFNAIKASGHEDPFIKRVEEAKAKLKAYEEVKGEA